MHSIEIVENGICLPKIEVENGVLNEKFNLDKDWIYKRSGIKKRYYIEKENIVDLSLGAVNDLLRKIDIDIQDIGIIVVATTSTEELMPGISFKIQKELGINKCICFDILAGCSGYINGFDIVRKYIATEEMKYGLVIGAEVLSKYTNLDDIYTAILLGDGAGATLVGKCNEAKKYFSNIESQGQFGEILTCKANEKIFMDGKKIYKFGTSKTVENIKELLNKTDIRIEDIKYIIPHQSNLRMLEVIKEKLNLRDDQLYLNIENVGNTFNASIPIALNELYKRLNKRDKIVLIGYGGGLNLGSILLEI